MITPMDALQDYLYNALTSDQILMGMVSGVFDYVPEQVALPFILIGEGTTNPGRFKGTHEVKPLIRIFSEYDGFQEAAEIMARMNTHFEKKNLGVYGYKAVSFGPETSRTAVVEDSYREIQVQYRVVMM